MKREAYAAARTIAPRLHAYFAGHREKALRRNERDVAAVPDIGTIEAMIDSAFWTSLRREEGFAPRISLAFLAPHEANHPLRFENALPLDPAVLTRVSRAVERPGIHLCVWRDREELAIWGATRGIPRLCFVLEVTAPGLLVVKHHQGDESRKFINVAVLEGDQIKLVDGNSATGSQSTPVLSSLLRLDSPDTGPQSSATLLQLAVSMREHGHGGSLLLVPSETELWRESILQPMQYAVSPPFAELAVLAQDAYTGRANAWKEAASPSIAAIGGLTAVDGAVVLNSRYELLGFGAKIVRRLGSPHIEQVMLSEPVQGAVPSLVHPEQLGGTRHLSAAQFVHDQRDSVALVASQDDRFTVFEWSASDEAVHAHRVEALLR